jgi:hypothetical protein
VGKIFPTFKVSATGLRKYKYSRTKAAEAQMAAQIQADEDRRIFEVLDGLAPVVHLLDFLLETGERLVAEYYPELQRSNIRLVPDQGMGAAFTESRRIIEIVNLYDDGEVSWCSRTPDPPPRVSKGKSRATRKSRLKPRKANKSLLGERLCWHTSRALYNGTNLQSIKYFERERSNHLWHEFIEETRKQQLIASMMVS